MDNPNLNQVAIAQSSLSTPKIGIIGTALIIYGLLKTAFNTLVMLMGYTFILSAAPSHFEVQINIVAGVALICAGIAIYTRSFATLRLLLVGGFLMLLGDLVFYISWLGLAEILTYPTTFLVDFAPLFCVYLAYRYFNKRKEYLSTSDLTQTIAKGALGLIVLAAVSVIGVNLYKNTSEKVTEQKVLNQSKDESTWQTYTNSTYGYSIQYPVGSIKEEGAIIVPEDQHGSYSPAIDISADTLATSTDLSNYKTKDLLGAAMLLAKRNEYDGPLTPSTFQGYPAYVFDSSSYLKLQSGEGYYTPQGLGGDGMSVGYKPRIIVTSKDNYNFVAVIFDSQSQTAQKILTTFTFTLQ